MDVHKHASWGCPNMSKRVQTTIINTHDMSHQLSTSQKASLEKVKPLGQVVRLVAMKNIPHRDDKNYSLHRANTDQTVTNILPMVYPD